MAKLLNTLITRYIKRHPEAFDVSKNDGATKYSKEDLKIVDLSDYVMVKYGVWKNAGEGRFTFITFGCRLAKQFTPKERNAYIKESGIDSGFGGWFRGNNRCAPFYKLINSGIVVPFLDISEYGAENIICTNFVKPAVSCFNAEALIGMGTKFTFAQLKKLDNGLSEIYMHHGVKPNKAKIETESKNVTEQTTCEENDAISMEK